jgi:Plasmid stabilization system protein
MPTVLIKPRARVDLVDIWHYIAVVSPTKADRLLDSLNTQFQKLARFPEIGRAREELAPSLRSFSVKRYAIFYRIIKDGVEIVRVLHGARDIESILEEE